MVPNSVFVNANIFLSSHPTEKSYIVNLLGILQRISKKKIQPDTLTRSEVIEKVSFLMDHASYVYNYREIHTMYVYVHIVLYMYATTFKSENAALV